MAITATGNSYTTGDQVTAATQNAQVNAATFVSGSVDNSTTQLSGGAIIVKDGGITPAKLSVGHPTWDTSSRVGIGTASPGYKLTVSEASTDFAALINNSTSSGNGLKINAGDNSGDRVLELNDKDGTSLMQVGATGNLTLNIGDLIISALTTPASASATGTVGTVAWDTNYFYVCTATNTWKRSGLSSW